MLFRKAFHDGLSIVAFGHHREGGLEFDLARHEVLQEKKLARF